MTIERHCIITGEEIRECMGFCLARDILAVSEGRQTYIREISGRGMLILERESKEAGFDNLWEYLDQSKYLNDFTLNK